MNTPPDTAVAPAPRPSGPDAARLPRPVIILGWVSLFADVSGEMIYPLLPLFLVGVLHASATSLGWVEGVATATVALLTAWAGWRSDRIVRGRRRRVRWVQWGYGLPVIGKALLAFAFAWPMVLAGRTVDRLGKGVRSSPRDAIIADAVPANQRGRAFGFHRAMDSAGAVIGVSASAGLLWWFTGSPIHGGPITAGAAEATHEAWAFRMVFGVAAVLGLISWAITFLLREDESVGSSNGATESPATQVSTEREPTAAAIAAPRTGPMGFSFAYWRTLMIMLVFALANSSDAFLLLRARAVGLSPWAVVLAYALFSVTYMGFSYPAGIISDRLGRWRVIGVGWAIYAGVYAGFVYTGSAGIWSLMALYGVSVALTDGVGKALIADHSPSERRGAALGIFYMLSGLVTLLASVTAGMLWDRVGPGATFGFGALVAALAIVLIPVLRSRSR